MKALLLVVLGLTMSTAAQADAGFKNGNDIDVTLYGGWVRVRCMDGGFDRSHYCRAAGFNPGSHDRFSVDGRVDADRVELTATHEDGSTKTKKAKFDSNKGSSKKINLLTRTVFQKPLLEVGLNQVNYSLTKKKREVDSGVFESRVEIAGDLRCPDMWISEWGATCDNAGSACNTYFNRVTGCQ